MTKIDNERKHSVVSEGSKSEPAVIPLSWLEVSKLNPRHQQWSEVKSLTRDIAARGLDQPIVLRAIPNGGYDVIMGSRRYLALKAVRGNGGFINAGEFRIVDWNDDKCIQAVIKKDKMRAELSLAEEAIYYSTVSAKLSREITVTSDILANKLGVDPVRVELLRGLMNCHTVLPEGWQTQFWMTGDSRTVANQQIQRILTMDHWRHVRPFISGTIPKEVRRVMNRCLKHEWSATKFKAALEALSPEGVKAVRPARERSPAAEPDYRKVLRSLKAAFAWTGNSKDMAHVINALIRDANGHLARQLAGKQARAA